MSLKFGYYVLLVLVSYSEPLDTQSIPDMLGNKYKPVRNLDENNANFNKINPNGYSDYSLHAANAEENAHLQAAAGAVAGGAAVDADHYAPQYMVDLYKKFESDRYSTPMANIVRSFVNIYKGKCKSREPFVNINKLL